MIFRAYPSSDEPSIADSDIKAVGVTHPAVQEVLDIQRRFPNRMDTKTPRHSLGGKPVEEIYIYSLRKVEVTIFGMVFEGYLDALHLSFEPHNPNSSLIVGEGERRQVYPAKTGIDFLVSAPEGARLARDEIGRTVLAWNLHDHPMESDANSVFSFAKLEMHGFRFLREPALV